MNEPFFAFEWAVAPGYAWVEWLDPDLEPVRPTLSQLASPDLSAAVEDPMRRVTGPVLTWIAGPSTLVRPMQRDNATLFRRFADLDATDTTAIQTFACQYGWLGVAPRPSQRLRG